MARTDEIREALNTYYRSEQCSDQPIQITEVERVGEGNQREMYYFTTVEGKGKISYRQPLVLRLYDGEGARYDAEYEYNVIKKLGRGKLPVPEVFALEMDATHLGKPFVIMERIQGENMLAAVMRTMDLEFSNLSIRNLMPWVSKLAELLVTIHSLDWRALGLDFMDHDQGNYNLVNDFIRWPFIGGPARRYPKFRELCDWILVRSKEVICSEPVLLHMDFHPQNVMVDGNRITAVIDWGEARIGDATIDVTWASLIVAILCIPGLDKAFIEEYRQKSGRQLKNLTFYEVMAGARRLGEYITLKDGRALDMSKRPDVEVHESIPSDFIMERTGIDISSLLE
ncbi:MAG: phosphotransferase family protein [Thermoplasmata archaeon]|nr:MAG: phosphotransferase family protein [Thermoplasmata archaeon]